MLKVRDASTVTKRNRDIAVNSYHSQWKAATMNTAGAKPVESTTSPGVTGAESLINNRAGCEAALVVTAFLTKVGVDPNQPLYPTNTTTGGASGLTGQS